MIPLLLWELAADLDLFLTTQYLAWNNGIEMAVFESLWLEHIMVEERETTLIMRYVRKYVRRIRRQQRPMRYRWRHHIISAAAVTVKKEQHLIRRRVLHLIISCFDHAMVNWRTLSNNWCLWRGGRNDVIRMGRWRQESVWWEKVYRKLCSPDGCKCKAYTQVKLCSSDGYTNIVVKGGVCVKHGAQAEQE